MDYVVRRGEAVLGSDPHELDENEHTLAQIRKANAPR
jgi:hypothetical protein